MIQTQYEKQVAYYKELADREARGSREVVALIALVAVTIIYFIFL